MEQHQSWDTIYLNLAKAFNKVEHKEFLKKHHMGIWVISVLFPFGQVVLVWFVSGVSPFDPFLVGCFGPIFIFPIFGLIHFSLIYLFAFA